MKSSDSGERRKKAADLNRIAHTADHESSCPFTRCYCLAWLSMRAYHVKEAVNTDVGGCLGSPRQNIYNSQRSLTLLSSMNFFEYKHRRQNQVHRSSIEFSIQLPRSQPFSNNNTQTIHNQLTEPIHVKNAPLRRLRPHHPRIRSNH